ncbi:UDP-3-O-(3-hydroxymyristoyl)glucosamine N-acyltransferase [Nitrospirillum pindoramense]|uniref:UDP-3-O-acylglucosamine N-acyltransferase n=1 Tax=Nitrospirillum amazonense TaxID=28077 RepID=A0A560HD39_9PROT|nr:UDP-3-O-(3-hydroxymyristoyl)glucosamine N-acyltransferase [Nitrospirillum amazonense]TWB44307.1 UDP-3-O-[3-hydroxymyristoyl] glucosamine N-acyltransferase [Nitrospirillum amazonense]
MADPRFFNRAGPFTLADLAQRSGAEIAPGCDPGLVLSDVAALDAADQGQLSFLDNKKYVAAFSATKAGAVVVHPALASKAPAGVALLLSRNPYKAYALCAQAFYPATAPTGTISAGAHVDPTAEVGQGTDIAAGAVVEAGAVIGARCRIGPNATIGINVRLGDDTVIGANASLTHCVVGSRVTIYPGARIGQDGFGFAMDLAGHVRVPQMGRVLIEDDVEIGANATVDRGAGPDTIIGRGCMIDNLVQIGHNVHLGAGCVIVAQAGISGSTRLDHHVVLAAQAGVTGHLKIGAGAQIAAQSGVMRDVEPGEKVGGSPAVPMRQWLRQVAALGRLVRGRNGQGDGRDD